MTDGSRESEIWRSKDGHDWRIGCEAEVAWIRDNTEIGLTVTSAIPPKFEAYATLELPGTGNQAVPSALDEAQAHHDAAVLAVLIEHGGTQPWWLGYLDTGDADVVFPDAPMVEVFPSWRYVLVEAGPDQARSWREEGWKGVLPDLIFPADRSWLVSTLWDDDWTCLGGGRELVDAFLGHPELRSRAREVDPSVKDMTPPGHVAY